LSEGTIVDLFAADSGITAASAFHNPPTRS
jgi:hypothetical protein